MTDRDAVGVFACILGLAALGLLHSWLISGTADEVAAIRADVDWLKDNTVATEARA